MNSPNNTINLSDPYYTRLRTFLDKHFSNTPLIARLAAGREEKLYGPFNSSSEAFSWFTKLPMGVKIQWHGLRNPYIKRTEMDFHLPTYMEVGDIQEKEFDHTIEEF
jgi:hypothetical protein